MLFRLPAFVRDLPDSVVRALAVPAPRARGDRRLTAGRTTRGGGGTPLGGDGAGAGPGWSPLRWRQGAAGDRAEPRPEGFPCLRPGPLRAGRRRKMAAASANCAQRNGGSAEYPDGVAQGALEAHARGGGGGTTWRDRAPLLRFPVGAPRERKSGVHSRTPSVDRSRAAPSFSGLCPWSL